MAETNNPNAGASDASSATETAEATTPAATTTPAVKTFTQQDVDDIIKKRLAETVSRKDFEKLQQEMARSKMTEEERVAAEIEAKQKEVLDRALAAEASLRLARAERFLSEAGLDPSDAPNLVGASDEETQARIDSLKAIVDKNVKSISDASIKKGAPNTGGNTPASNTTLTSERLRAVGYSDADIQRILDMKR